MEREPGWLERRIPLRRWTRQALTEDIPGGASYWYVFGSAAALDFLILAATGIWQFFYYVPSTERAYDSVNYLRLQVPFGWLIHGVHYWAATAMVVLVLVHLTQTFVWGAFKKPRELTWLLGVLLLLLTLLAVFTGTPLPWDKRGYLAAQVANGIAGSMPLVGTLAKGLLFLTHLVAFRIPGSAASFSERRNLSRSGRFWPDQLLKDFIAFSVVFTGTVGLSSLLMTPINGAADALDATYIGKPEWPFLFLYQILKYLPGRLEVVGALVVPLIGLVLLFGVPWFDRSAERAPRRRPVALVLFAVIAAAIVALSVQGAGGPTEIVSKSSGPAASVSSTSTPTTSTVEARAPYIVGNAEHGATLFVDFCESCHGVKGTDNVTNGIQGPALDPIDPLFVSNDPQTFAVTIDDIIQHGSRSNDQVLMPAFGASSTMTQPQIADAEAYVLKLNKVDRAKVLKPGVDPRTFFLVTLVLFGLADAAGIVGLARLRR
jgi:ubiquinol-cytochrome c reductase cytochrome b subunit